MEEVLLVLLVLIVVSLIIMHMQYRMQIKDFANQMRYHRLNDSNIDISASCNSSEVKMLQKELNLIKDEMQVQQLKYEKNEERIKAMITDISHDIRTPLTSVSGYFQMLDDAKDDEEREYYKKIISDRIVTLSTMLDEFFVYSKVQQNMDKREICLVDLREVLSKTLLSYYDVLKEKKITPRIDICEDVCTVMGIEEDFQRIFLNLIKNVVSHGGEKMQLSMCCVDKKIKIVFENYTEEKLPDNIDEVFERFYKGDVARSGLTSTGLGLCIVKELVEKNRGSVKAYSDRPHWFGIEMIFESIS